MRNDDLGSMPPPRAAPPPPPPPPPAPAAPPRPREGEKGTATHYVLPMGRSPWAVAAGYLGLLSLIPFVHLLAIAIGVMGLRHVADEPHLGGRGRAWFGIGMGALFTLVWGWAVIAAG